MIGEYRDMASFIAEGLDGMGVVRGLWSTGPSSPNWRNAH